MGLKDDLLAKMQAWKALADARAQQAAPTAVPLLSAELLAKGHPKVSRVVVGDGLVYGVRQGSGFGWCWLIFTMVHCFFMFSGLRGGTVAMNHRLLSNPSLWDFILLGLFYIPFFLVGFGFTLARYRIELTSAAVAVRWRILPWIGWTWRLSAGEEVAVTLAFRGSSEDEQPLPAVVISSQGKEISFGSFLPAGVKEFLAGAILDYYQGAEPSAAPFIPRA